MIFLAKRKGTLLEQNTCTLFTKAGFDADMNVRLSGYEIDVLARYKNLRIVIECKQYENSGLVVRNLIHQWADKNKEFNADKVLLIVLGVDVSHDDLQLAKSRGISIWDQDKFQRFFDRVHEEKEDLRPEILRDIGLTADGTQASPKSEAQIKMESFEQQKKEMSELLKQYKKEWALDYSSLIIAYECSEGAQEILVFVDDCMKDEIELFPKVVKTKILVEAGTQPESIAYNNSIHVPIIEAELKKMITYGIRKTDDEVDDNDYPYKLCWPHTLMFVDIDVGKEEIDLAKRNGMRCVVCRDLKPGTSKNQKGLIILIKSDLMEHKQNVLTKFGAGEISEPEKKTSRTGLVAIILLILFAFLLFSSGDKSDQAAQLAENQKALPPTAQQLLEYAVRINNVSFCGTLSQSDKEQCIIRFASASPAFNYSLCETISNDAKIECYTASAKARSNSDICLKLASDADIKTCYWDFVNSRTCSAETKCFDGDGVKNCLECKLEVANLSRKDLIELEDCTSASSNDCYIKDRRIAIYLGEPKGCFNGVDCHTLMAQKHSISLKKCDSIGADYVYCYMGVAYATTNFSICAQLPTVQYRNSCEDRIATDVYHLKLIKDLSVCFSASVAGITPGTDRNYRWLCGEQAAIYNGDNFIYENCELLYQLSLVGTNYYSPPLVTSCSYDKAIKTKNITLCSRAGNKQTECEGIINHLNGS